MLGQGLSTLSGYLCKTYLAWVLCRVESSAGSVPLTSTAFLECSASHVPMVRDLMYMHTPLSAHEHLVNVDTCPPSKVSNTSLMPYKLQQSLTDYCLIDQYGLNPNVTSHDESRMSVVTQVGSAREAPMESRLPFCPSSTSGAAATMPHNYTGAPTFALVQLIPDDIRFRRRCRKSQAQCCCHTLPSIRNLHLTF